MIIPQTDYIRTQEKCISLRDVDRFDPLLGEKRRYEIITVVRDDAPAEFERDVGATKDFPKKPLFWGIGAVIDDENKPELIEYVGVMMDVAQEYRVEPPWYKDRGFLVSDLPAIYQQKQELKVEDARRRGL